jgi:hypothetical protein
MGGKPSTAKLVLGATAVDPALQAEIDAVQQDIVARERRLGELYLQAGLQTQGVPRDVQKFVLEVLRDVQKGMSPDRLARKYGDTTMRLLRNANMRLTTDDQKTAFAAAMQAAASMYDIDLSAPRRSLGGAIMTGLALIALLMVVVFLAIMAVDKLQLHLLTSDGGFSEVNAMRWFDAMFPGSGRDKSHDLLVAAEAVAQGTVRDLFRLLDMTPASKGGRGHGHGSHYQLVSEDKYDGVLSNPLIVYALRAATPKSGGAEGAE